MEDMKALPPGKDYKDKYYIGFFQHSQLAAVMDLIADYPQKGTAWIGFFAVNIRCQKRGVGTGIISDCAACLKQLGFEKIRPGIDKGNTQSRAFWTKNRFVLTEGEISAGETAFCMMERRL